MIKLANSSSFYYYKLNENILSLLVILSLLTLGAEALRHRNTALVQVRDYLGDYDEDVASI